MTMSKYLLKLKRRNGSWSTWLVQMCDVIELTSTMKTVGVGMRVMSRKQIAYLISDNC